MLLETLGRERGVTFRDLALSSGRSALLIFLEGNTNLSRLEEHLISPLRGGMAPGHLAAMPGSSVPTVEEAMRSLHRGKVLVQTSEMNELCGLAFGDIPFRPIPEPQTETGVTGPREAFTESLTSNLAQVRRRMPSPDLRLESIWIGSRAHTEVVICHKEGAPTPEMLQTLKERLQRITNEGLQDVSELVEAVSDRPITLFPTVLITERPDIVVHYMHGGRLVVFMENSPRALILPALFIDFFISVDDYYDWRPFVAMMRMLRLFSFNLAIPLPAFYVSVTTFHLQALPTLLTLNLLTQREGAPLPPPIESLIMTSIFEVLREAAVRLPRAIGPTVSIVGGLVIGDAAIRSGLTSPAMVLVVTATAVASFLLPSPSLANTATYYRFALLLLSSAFGFFGLLIGYLLVLTHLSSLTSLGVPYMSPLFPFQAEHLLYTLGLKPRPPASTGGRPDAALTQTAQDFHEGGQTP